MKSWFTQFFSSKHSGTKLFSQNSRHFWIWLGDFCESRERRTVSIWRVIFWVKKATKATHAEFFSLRVSEGHWGAYGCCSSLYMREGWVVNTPALRRKYQFQKIWLLTKQTLSNLVSKSREFQNLAIWRVFWVCFFGWKRPKMAKMLWTSSCKCGCAKVCGCATLMSIQPSGTVNATPRARMRFFVQKIAGRVDLTNFDLNGLGTSIWVPYNL